MVRQCYLCINSVEGVVHFFVFFTLLSLTRLSKSSSPSSESWDKGKVTPISKIFFFVLISHSYFFFVFQIQCFCFYDLFMFFNPNKQNAFEKQIESNEKKKTSHCKIQWVVNTFMARRISFMPAEKTSNALQRLLNEL